MLNKCVGLRPSFLNAMLVLVQTNTEVWQVFFSTFSEEKLMFTNSDELIFANFDD